MRGGWGEGAQERDRSNSSRKLAQLISSQQYLGHTNTEKLFAIYLKFIFNCASYSYLATLHTGGLLMIDILEMQL